MLHSQSLATSITLIHFRASSGPAPIGCWDSIRQVLAHCEGSRALKIGRIKHFELLGVSHALQLTVVPHLRCTAVFHLSVTLSFEIHWVIRCYSDVLLCLGWALSWGWIDIVVCLYFDSTTLKVDIRLPRFSIIWMRLMGSLHARILIATTIELLPVTPMLFLPLLRRSKLTIVPLGCLLFQIGDLLFQEEVLRLWSHL